MPCAEKLDSFVRAIPRSEIILHQSGARCRPLAGQAMNDLQLAITTEDVLGVDDKDSLRNDRVQMFLVQNR